MRYPCAAVPVAVRRSIQGFKIKTSFTIRIVFNLCTMQHNNSKQRIEKIARQNLSSLGYGTGTKKVLYRGICVPSNYPLTRET